MITDLLARYGLIFSYDSSKINMRFYGNCINAKELPDIIHEFCHFLVATPERRTLPNLGLAYENKNCTKFDYEDEVYAAMLTHILIFKLNRYYNLGLGKKELGYAFRMKYLSLGINKRHNLHINNDNVIYFCEKIIEDNQALLFV